MKKRAVMLGAAVALVAIAAMSFASLGRRKPGVSKSGTASGTARNAQEVAAATKALLSEPPIVVNIAPDGRQLLMQTQDAVGYRLTLVDRATRDKLATIQTGGRPRLSAWSPDGHKIAYATDVGSAEYQMWIWDLQTLKVLRPKVPLSHIVTQAKWTNDSRFITHVVEPRGGPRALYRVEAKDGAVPTSLAAAITPKAGLAWSPDGNAIATVRANAPHAVAIIDVSGRQNKTMAAGSNAEIRDLAYAPDGRTLLMAFRHKAGDSFQLAAADPRKGKGTVRAMPASPVVGDVVSPLFLPDGGGIVIRVYPGNEKLVFVCNQRAMACRPLGAGGTQATPWAVSPDGGRLFLGQLIPNWVREVDLATGQSSNVYEAPPPEGVGEDNGRIDVASFDGLQIPAHVRRGRAEPGVEPPVFVQVLGAIGRESPAPWDGKAEYLYRRGLTVVKIYVRGKAGFGRALQDAPGGNAERVKDILAVLDHVVRALKVPADRIVLFGHSDGAMLAAKAAAAGAPVGSLVLSSMVKDPDPVPPVIRRCVVAFQGQEDSLEPDKARIELEKILGPGTTREPCGRFQALQGEAHELERADSWAEVFAAAVTAVIEKGER